MVPRGNMRRRAFTFRFPSMLLAEGNIFLLNEYSHLQKTSFAKVKQITWYVLMAMGVRDIHKILQNDGSLKYVLRIIEIN